MDNTWNGLKIRVEHYRYVDTKLETLTNWPRKWEHPYPPQTKGGQTIVVLIREGYGEDSDVVVGLGTAVCSKKDNFCYKLGREIALGRAKKAYLDKYK